MTPLALWLILTLAAYRLWRLLALDDLPGLAEARYRLTTTLDERGYDRYADAIPCPWCLGFWCCVAVFGTTHALATPLTLWPLQAAAASTLVGLIGAHADG